MEDKIIAATKKNFVKRKFPYIDTFDNQGTTMVHVMHNVAVGVFEHLDTTYPMDVDKRIEYTHHILWGTVLNKYKVLEGCNNLEKGLSGDQWELVPMNNVITKKFHNWTHTDANNGLGDMHLGHD